VASFLLRAVLEITGLFYTKVNGMEPFWGLLSAY
jgi:hypothetical protein